jgi:hypothetical protein
MHSPRRQGETRPHIVLYPPGTKVKYQTVHGPAYATVSSVDEGGWIYPIWVHKPTKCLNLPNWFRSTQVQKLDTFPSFMEATVNAA